MREVIEVKTYGKTKGKTFFKRKLKFFYAINVLLLISFIACTVSAFFIGDSANEEISGFHAVTGSSFAVIAVIHLISKAKYFFSFLRTGKEDLH